MLFDEDIHTSCHIGYKVWKLKWHFQVYMFFIPPISFPLKFFSHQFSQKCWHFSKIIPDFRFLYIVFFGLKMRIFIEAFPSKMFWKIIRSSFCPLFYADSNYFSIDIFFTSNSMLLHRGLHLLVQFNYIAFVKWPLSKNPSPALCVMYCAKGLIKAQSK